MKRKCLSICVYSNALFTTLLAVYFFFIPLLIVIHDLEEQALYTGEMPRFAYRWHSQLSDRFAAWARKRITSGDAKELSIENISGTEWPMFSAVFYLWATEALQEAWEEDPDSMPTMPKVYAREAIEEAVSLISDPNNAAWVREHWGDNYLQRENIFYRMLLISGLTSYQKLLGNEQYADMLLNQVVSLSEELDSSPYGLLDDYPGQCYPIDILPAIAAIRRADSVLGTDHSGFAARAIRAFEGARLDSQTQLPAYSADSTTGLSLGPARGVGIAYMLIWAPELWPEVAESWYTKFESYFWQKGRVFDGVREYTKESSPGPWLVDVDAGPVFNGLGTAASAFGIGAARANGRSDHAFSLSAEALVAAWPLADGTLLTARILSNLSDAPYIGETAMLFNFTRRPLASNDISTNHKLPFSVYLGLFLYALFGIFGISLAFFSLKYWRNRCS